MLLSSPWWYLRQMPIRPPACLASSIIPYGYKVGVDNIFFVGQIVIVRKLLAILGIFVFRFCFRLYSYSYLPSFIQFCVRLGWVKIIICFFCKWVWFFAMCDSTAVSFITFTVVIIFILLLLFYLLYINKPTAGAYKLLDHIWIWFVYTGENLWRSLC